MSKDRMNDSEDVRGSRDTHYSLLVRESRFSGLAASEAQSNIAAASQLVIVCTCGQPQNTLEPHHAKKVKNSFSTTVPPSLLMKK